MNRFKKNVYLTSVIILCPLSYKFETMTSGITLCYSSVSSLLSEETLIRSFSLCRIYLVSFFYLYFAFIGIIKRYRHKYKSKL